MWYPVVRQMRVCQSKEFTCEFTLCKPYTKFDPCDSTQYLLLCRNSRLQLAFRWSFWNGNRGQKLPSEHGRLGPLVFARFLIFLSAWGIPSGDPCDFFSSSVKDLKRILKGIALFSRGNEEFLEEACNWEVSWILTRFETICCSEDTLLSIPFESGCWSGGPKILEETCNWEVIRNLTRLITRLDHDPRGLFTDERKIPLRILRSPDATISDFLHSFGRQLRIFSSYFKEHIRILFRFVRDLTRIVAGS